LNNGYALLVVTSLLFGACHWWTGIGNIVEAVLIDVLLMLFYRRSVALWPVVLAHYLTDTVDTVGLTMKLVGKPDAGNRHVRL
jgi:CAAX protease family protein